MNPVRRMWLLACLLALHPLDVLAKPTWPGIKRLIDARFPGIAQLSTAQLRDWPAQAPVLLLDVRATSEFEVSHLQAAQHTPTLAQARAAIQTFRAQAPQGKVVLYCSVGYRSAQMAHALQREAVAQVFNLEGGIFAWANAALPVQRQGQAVQQVHPYDAQWGTLLNAPLHAATAQK
jgi:rhodanese-related sulfurtransferase